MGADVIEPGGREHPRPQMKRAHWVSLNGTWDFLIDKDAKLQRPPDVDWQKCKTIEVPFAPETERSGINDTSFYSACWYRKTFTAPELNKDQRLFLHFGAVDYQATVWI